MAKHILVITMKDGKVVYRDMLAAVMKSLPDGRHMVEITSGDKRTNPQNRYYWGAVIPLVRKGIVDLGTEVTSEETHEFLKAKFNYSELVNQDTGECELIPRSTTGLNTIQFNEYIAKIQQFAAEFLHVVIPDPGEQVTIQY